MGEGIGLVDPVVNGKVSIAVYGMERQVIQVDGQQLCTDILLSRHPVQTRGVFQVQLMFQAIEVFLNAPTLVIQGREICSGIAQEIQQICHHHMNQDLGCRHSNQAHRSQNVGSFIVRTFGQIQRAHPYKPLDHAGTKERLNPREAGFFSARAEQNAQLRKQQDKPANRIALVQNQQIRSPQAKQIEGEGSSLLGVLRNRHHEEQEHLVRIGSHYVKDMPTARRALVIHEDNQLLVDLGKCQKRGQLAGLGKHLSGDQANEIALIPQMGLEGVQLILDSRHCICL